jgi:zinc protease
MKKTLTILIVAATILLLIPSKQEKKTAATFSQKIEHVKLSNGLEVYVVQNHRVPAITQMVWYKVGSGDDPDGKSGLAHYMEHLMFKGSANLGSGDFSEMIAKFGGNENAQTSYDYTNYHQTISREYLELVMMMEADRMRRLNLDPEEASTELNVIKEERAMRIDNRPRTALAEQMYNKLFSPNSYSIPIIGTPQDIAGLTSEDAITFHNANYAPNNAILIIAGDTTLQEVKPLAEKWYGTIPAGNTQRNKRRDLLPEPEKLSIRKLELSPENTERPEWMKYYIAPSATTGSKQHVFPLIVLDQILGGSENSRLYKSLVINQKIANAAYSYYDSLSMGYSVFGIGATPAENISHEQVGIAASTVLEDIIKNGITKEELERAKNGLITNQIYSQDSLDSYAAEIGEALVSGLPADYVDNWSKNIAKVTAEDVGQAARKIFKNESSVEGWLKLPDKKTNEPPVNQNNLKEGARK